MSDSTLTAVAEQVASQLGLPRPNELLAKNLISLARSLPTEQAFVKAAKGFGRFPDDGFLTSIRDRIRAEASTSTARPTVASRNEDTLEPQQPVRAGLNVMGGTEVSDRGAYLDLVVC